MTWHNAFPCWTNITSSQMERLRAAERKCLRMCINYRRNPGDHYISNETLYKEALVDRIDLSLVQQALKFYEKSTYSESPIISSLQPSDHDHIFDIFTNIKPPDYIAHLSCINTLLTGNRLLYYNRRYDGRDELVYSTGQ